MLTCFRVSLVARWHSDAAVTGSPTQLPDDGLGRGRRLEDRRDDALSRVRVLEAVARQHADDRRAPLESARLRELSNASDAGRRRWLAENAFEADEVAIRRTDLLVGHGLDEAARLIACADRLLPRRGVANPDRRRE